jgi:hypothetical protein
MCKPVDSTYFSRISFITLICIGHAGIIIKVSSTYWTMGKSMLKSYEKVEHKSPSLYALLIADWSRSTARTKMNGEYGSPCLTPLLQKNHLPGTPFINTEDLPVLKIISIQSNHLSSNLICAIILVAE